MIKTARLGIDQMTDDQGTHLHVARLVQLKAWAEEIELTEDRLTFSVLEGPDPGQAIIDYATQNHADHILMGARGHSTARRYLGSVSAQVVAEAACSVTVVRLREGQARCRWRKSRRQGREQDGPSGADRISPASPARCGRRPDLPTPATVLQASGARRRQKDDAFIVCLLVLLSSLPLATRCPATQPVAIQRHMVEYFKSARWADGRRRYQIG